MIPKTILDEGRKISRDATLYGITLDKMTRDELICLCAYGWNEYNKKLNTQVIPIIAEVEKRKKDK